jgi:two-component system sensor histidine kinase YesM
VTHLKEYLSFYERTTDVHVRVDIQLEPAAADAEMPSLILQPLVENALEHGLREAPKAARIAVSGYARNGSLFLTVRDNGSGMSPEMLQSVRNSLHGDVPPRAHVGIWNVNRRIRLLFGDQYGLYVESTPSHGTEVRVELQNR